MSEYAAALLFGGVIYLSIEIIFRGWTHWSMFFCGGVSFLLLYIIANFSRDALWKKWLMGASVITAAEYVFGLLLNVRLGWRVWDYSHQWGNLYGQICPLFSLCWLFLCIPGIKLCTVIRQKIFGLSTGGKYE